MSRVIVRVQVRGADVDLVGDKGTVSCGYLKTSEWGTYRWYLNGPGGTLGSYFTQEAGMNWRLVLAQHLMNRWGWDDVLIIGDDLYPGPKPRPKGLL